jgi:hypothetical protein
MKNPIYGSFQREKGVIVKTKILYEFEIYFVSPHWNPSIEDQAIARSTNWTEEDGLCSTLSNGGVSSGSNNEG